MLLQSSMRSKRTFSILISPCLHSGCLYSRAVSRTHTLDSRFLLDAVSYNLESHQDGAMAFRGFTCNCNSCYFFFFLQSSFACTCKSPITQPRPTYITGVFSQINQRT